MNLLPSVFRINQTGYRTGFPVFVSVLSDDPVRLIDDNLQMLIAFYRIMMQLPEIR